MKRVAESYYFRIGKLLKSVEVTDKRREKLNFYTGIAKAIEIIKRQIRVGKKLIFIGNGGSAAISSHMAVDFWKNGKMKAITFNDVSLLTCVSNDFGYKYVFAKPIEMFADSGDILIAISSSGKSENILLGVKAAKAKGVKVITLSGFNKDNPLRRLGEINFYVPSTSYGHVEITHLSICHCLLDIIMGTRSEPAKS